MYKNTIVSIAIIIVVLVVILFFGLQLLVKFSLLLGRIKSTSEIPTDLQTEFVLSPTLNPLFEATNSAVIEVSGIGSEPGQTIELFLNGERKTDTIVNSNSQFTFSQLRLESGENRIQVRAKKDGKESEFSNQAMVTLDTTPPALEVKEPTDGQIIRKDPQVRIVGKTESESSIFINDFLPIVDTNGNFLYSLPLSNGENSIKIVARDKAGNQTTNEIKVTFEP